MRWIMWVLIRLELFGVMQALDKLLQPAFELQWKQ